MSENNSGASWYLLRTGTQSGPFAKQTIIEFVRKAELSPSDFVWRPGWEAWVHAAEVEGLFSPPSQASVYGYGPTNPNKISNELEREIVAFDLLKEGSLTEKSKFNPIHVREQTSQREISSIGRYEYDKVATYSYIAAILCFAIVPVAIVISLISLFMLVYFYDFLRPGVIGEITWRQYDNFFDKLFHGNLIANAILIFSTLFAAGYSSSWIVKYFFKKKITGKFTKYVSLVYALIWFGAIIWAYSSYGVSTELLIWIIAFFGLKGGLEMGNDYFRPINITLS